MEFTSSDRLVAVNLIEDRPRARTPEIEQELNVAIYDLIEENRFRPALRPEEETAAGPFRLGIGMVERMLLLSVKSEDDEATLVAAVKPALSSKNVNKSDTCSLSAVICSISAGVNDSD